MGYADIGTARVQAQFYESHPSEDPGVYDHAGGELVVGTVLGHHSIAETRELAALIDFQVRAADDLIAKHQPLPTDAATASAMARWRTWRENWQKTRDKVLFDLRVLSFSSPLTPATLQAAETHYVKLKCAINKSCDESHTDPGDMREVTTALEKALGESADLSGFRAQFPEQSQISDPDMTAFQKLDAAVKTLDKVREPPPKPWWSVPWWGYALGIVTVGGIGYSFYRVAQAQRKRAVASDLEALMARDPLAGIMLPPSMALPAAPAPVVAPALPPAT